MSLATEVGHCVPGEHNRSPFFLAFLATARPNAKAGRPTTLRRSTLPLPTWSVVPVRDASGSLTPKTIVGDLIHRADSMPPMKPS